MTELIKDQIKELPKFHILVTCSHCTEVWEAVQIGSPDWAFRRLGLEAANTKESVRRIYQSNFDSLPDHKITVSVEDAGPCGPVYPPKRIR